MKLQLIRKLECFIRSIIRGVAQPGSASGLGPEGRRFKSYRPDHLENEKSENI